MRITANISTNSPSLSGNISNDSVNLNGNLSIGEFDPSNLKVRVTNLENNAVGTIDLSYDNQTSILTLTTKNIKNENIGTPQTVVISGGISNIEYDNTTKNLIITLSSGDELTVSLKESFDELAEQIPTKLSELQNDTGFITRLVDNLTNYYLKSETYTKTEVNNIIAAIPKVKLAIVQTLPEAGPTYWFENSHTIYLAPKSTSQTNNIYDEYLCTRSGTEGSYVYSWEKIGDTAIDLSNYVEKEITSEQTIGPYSVTTYNNVDNQMSMTGLGSTLNRKFDFNDGTELGAWLAVNTLGIIMMHTGMASSPDAQSATSSVNVEVDASYGITINQLANNITKSIIFRNGNVTADAFIKNGGTSSQFLKADGSIDNNVYSTILVNNVIQSSLSFNSDPQTQISSKIPISDYSDIVTSRILSNISMNYDSNNHGFNLGAQGYYYNNGVKTEVNTGYGLWIKLTDKFTVEQPAGGLRTLDIDLSKLNIPTKTSDLNNDSGFITNVVDNLTNYYLKSETYTQSQVNALIAAIKTVKLEIVSTLPTADATTYFNDSKTIYAIRNSATSGSDYYEEYITVRTGSEGSYTYRWEKIGDTQIDLSNYVQKTFTIAGIDLQDNITKSELQTALTDSTHNFVTDTEKSKWDAKQDALVSGTNIKTIKNTSLLGSGNIDINDITQITTPTNMWELSQGIYYGQRANFYYKENTPTSFPGSETCIVIITSSTIASRGFYMFCGKDMYIGNALATGGSYSYKAGVDLLSTTDIINNLVSTLTTAPLSANQGRVLKGLIDTVENRVNFIKTDVVSGLDWATFNTSNFNTIFGTGWDTQLGSYGCRANTSDDTSGIASGFGFSGTYYVEFKVWYVGTNDVGLFITISDSGTKNVATANILENRATNTDIHSYFFSPYAEKVDKTNLANKLYGTSSLGTQDLHTYSFNNANAWTFVQRDANGDVFVPSTPTSNNGATSKQYVNTYNMCPSSSVASFTNAPQTATVLFQAPCNGVAYLRYSYNGTGYIGFHLQSASGSDKAYNTQRWNDSGEHLYNATFVMKAGQRIYCYEVSSGITLNWGGAYFVKSEEQS